VLQDGVKVPRIEATRNSSPHWVNKSFAAGRVRTKVEVVSRIWPPVLPTGCPTNQKKYSPLRVGKDTARAFTQMQASSDAVNVSHLRRLSVNPLSPGDTVELDVIFNAVSIRSVQKITWYRFRRRRSITPSPLEVADHGGTM